MKLRKLLSLVLIFAMVFPIFAFAEDGENFIGLNRNERYDAIREDVFDYIKESREIISFETDEFEPEDNVRIIVEMDEEPAIHYSIKENCKYTELSANFRNDIESNILSQQMVVKNAISNNNINMEYKNNFSVAFNGFSGQVQYKDLEVIRRIPGVKDVYLSTEFRRPENEFTPEASNKMIGSDAVWESEYKGQGMVIAIIDSGVDPYHRDMKLSEETIPKYDEESINKLISEKSLLGKYFNEKVPYGHNYFDNNNIILDLGPFASEHGMHVAGIAAANGDLENDGVKGVAPEAQILAMKIFSNDSDPENAITYVDIYIKAIDDAIKLGADALNMSIGAACGAYEPNSPGAKAIINAVNNGIVCSISAGNAGHIGRNHYLKPFKRNPDVGTLSFPGLVKETVSVASIDSNTEMVPYLTYEEIISSVLPSNSIIVNDKAYDIRYLNNNKEAQIDLITNYSAGNLIYIKLNDNRIVNIKGEIIDNPSELPERVTYYDSNGNIYEYDVIGEDDSTETKNVKVPMKLLRNSPDPAKEIGEPIEYVYCGLGSEREFDEADVWNKVALIQDGEVSFSTKLENAYYAGAKAVVLFNTEADGDDLSNKSYPEYSYMLTAFIGNSFGQAMAEADKKVLTFTNNLIGIPNQKGGKMSVFSSWGTTPTLELKPDITAPGGNIYSTLQNDRYGIKSGTSMAAPHIAGASSLVMQYVKSDEKFEGLTAEENARMVKKLLMSTAGIVLDKDGMPCSPRQQGSGLANINAAIKTPVYIVDKNANEAKVELKDFEETNFKLNLRAYNISNEDAKYEVDVYVLADKIDSRGGNLLLSREMTADIVKPETIIVPANGYKDFEVDVDFSEDELKYRNMFVEGFVILKDKSASHPEISIPYVGFYGDWTEPDILDGLTYGQ